MIITALAGGVGAARFLEGLIKIVPQENLTVIVNTGDDIKLFGLYISPDIDIVMYTLAGIVDEGKGWGIREDTFHCLETLKLYGHETWFELGDRDLATHIYRTQLLRQGLSLSKVTKKISQYLGLKLHILPMSNDKVETKIVTDQGTMHFQEYLVKRKAQDRVLDVILEGAERASPAPGVVNAIRETDGIIICPSNPIVSIGTTLSIKGIKDALKKTKARVIAISPIIGGSPVKGPADRLMRGLGLEVSAYAVANLYKDFIDVFVIDLVDHIHKEKIEGLGPQVVVTNTIMRSIEDKIQLAKVVLEQLKNS